MKSWEFYAVMHRKTGEIPAQDRYCDKQMRMIKIRGALSQVYSQDGCTELRGFRRYSDRSCGHAMNLVWLFFMYGYGQGLSGTAGTDTAGEAITVHGKIEYGIETNDVNGWLRWPGETPAQVISVAV